MAGYVITVDFEIDAEAHQRFLTLVRENARRSVADEPGCRRFDVALPRDGSSRVFLYEIYDDEAAFHAHMATPHFKSFATATKDMVKGRKISALDLLGEP
ncbi:MAG: putative quinol monooxygenase [Alphaproteobacteria bacterium]